MKTLLLTMLLVFGPLASARGEIVILGIDSDLAKREKVVDAIFRDVTETVVTLSAQPMVSPRPAKTETSELRVAAVHDGRWAAFRLRWKDIEKSASAKTGEFSDAVAIQFPVQDGETPPPFFMGVKGQPVHILHWRAQYQAEEALGRRDVKDLYPNHHPDMYPMEFKDPGNVKGLTDEKREAFSPAKAAGNPQAFLKVAVDELLAEGFGTSSAMTDKQSFGFGEWKDGTWTVYVARMLKRDGASSLREGRKTFASFAVWQGGLGEVGSRKSVTMGWIPVSWKRGER